MAPNSVFTVVSLCKGFSSYHEIKDVIEYAKITGMTYDNSRFLVDSSIVISDVEIDLIYVELNRRVKAFDLNLVTEFTIREFISPILVSALVILDNANIRMTAEKKIVGKRANGSVDFDIMYRHFHICIVEAKKEAFEAGIAQNIAQLVASRDELLYGIKKRLYSDTFTDDNVKYTPSSGIVSTGDEWLFTRYVYENNVWKMFVSDKYYVSIQNDKNVDKKAQIKHLLKAIISMLHFQKNKVDEICITKRTRTKCNEENL